MCNSRLFFLIATFAASAQLSATGLVRDGRTARTEAMGGTSVAIAGSPLEAMLDNPAALAEIGRTSAEITINGIVLRSRLNRDGEFSTRLRNTSNFLGDVAIAIPSGAPALRFGLAASPSSAAATDWHFRDRKGGLGGETSYGDISHHSEFLAYDFRAGFGVQIAPWISAGVSAGVIYNENALNTAYVFQSQRTLQGFKTRLDLETDGYAPVAQLGITLQPASVLKISASYTTAGEVQSRGHAHADLSAQLDALGGGFAAVDPRLDADAEVLTKLPQKFAAGIAWQATQTLLFSSEFDWIGWSTAFDNLPVTLSNSSNAAVNNLVGSSTFTDVVPLRWNDQKIIRVGVEWTVAPQWNLRAGFAHSSRVTPSETLTALSAAIDDTIVSLGAGYEQADWRFDVSWQWHLPKTRDIGRSDLKSSEYSQSSLELESHWLGLTIGRDF